MSRVLKMSVDLKTQETQILTSIRHKGREGRSQTGPKGHQLEVAARRAPLTSSFIILATQIWYLIFMMKVPLFATIMQYF